MKTKQLLLYFIVVMLLMTACTPEEQQSTFSSAFSDVSVEVVQTAVSIACRNESVDDVKVHASVLLSKSEDISNPTKYPLSLVNDTLSGIIKGLEKNTQYYLCLEAYTNYEHKRSEEVYHFETSEGGDVAVTTLEVVEVELPTAKSGGKVVVLGNHIVSARGLCWDTKPFPNALLSPHVVCGEGSGMFNGDLTGLTAATTYYVRAYAMSDNVVYYGNEKVFTTQAVQAPTVVTGEVTDITVHSATVAGNVTSDGGLAVTERGVCWSTNPNPTVYGSHASSGTGTGAFTVSLTDLTPNTQYYVRAYAKNGNRIGYGSEVTFTTQDEAPTVVTGEVTDITEHSATVAGNVTSDGGYEVTERGICWSMNPNPTIEGNHLSNGTGTGAFTVNLTNLTANTQFYIRAYATNSAGTAYGSEVTFTTSGGGGSHAYVDLGLPSGTLWATCNVGADNPEDYGDYFAWGETQPKDTYDWGTYQYCMGNSTTLTKYCSNSSYGYNGFTDNLTTLLPEDDAATFNWGSDWRMPTETEWQELLTNTIVTWTTQNGVNGSRFTASNGNSLFLPAAGYRRGGELSGVGSSGGDWSSALNTGYPRYAWYFGFDSGCSLYDNSRGYGYSVRAVRSAHQN